MKHEIDNIIEELGFIGGIVDSDFQRRQLLQQGSIDNVVQPGAEFGNSGIGLAPEPAGFGTSHMLYNKAYNKHQYATAQARLH